MSKMFIVAIEDKDADAFLAGLQDEKTVAYPSRDGKFRKAGVNFVYLTDTHGKCTKHQA